MYLCFLSDCLSIYLPRGEKNIYPILVDRFWELSVLTMMTMNGEVDRGKVASIPSSSTCHLDSRGEARVSKDCFPILQFFLFFIFVERRPGGRRRTCCRSISKERRGRDGFFVIILQPPAPLTIPLFLLTPFLSMFSCLDIPR